MPDPGHLARGLTRVDALAPVTVVDDGPIVVVGASLAGLRAVETLRREGFDGRLVLVGAEPHLPYDRPPLSKELLAGEWEHDRTVLRTAALRRPRPRAAARAPRPPRSTSARARSSWPAATRLALRRSGHRDRLDAADAPVGPGARRRVHAAHARRLPRDPRLVSTPGARVVVIGAGFIGSEVAATCRKRGLGVTVLEALPQPMVRGVGTRIGARLGAAAPSRRASTCDSA